MAAVLSTGVFGIPVTKAVLIATGDYPDPSKITQKDLAKYAETHSTADQRDKDAQTYVENLKKQWGTGVSSLNVFYNATGDTLQLVNAADFSGHQYNIPPPARVENGQWGAFLHVKTSGAAKGSSGAVVYRGKLNNDTKDWFLSWHVPWSGSNKVYTEIQAPNHWPNVGSWDYMYNVKLKKSNAIHEYQRSGRKCFMQIGDHTSPMVRSMLTLL